MRWWRSAAWTGRSRPDGSATAQGAADATDWATLRLGLEVAAAAHEAWRIRLDTWRIGACEHPPALADLCFDERCELGRWLAGPGRARLSHLPAYQRLRTQHQRVHVGASQWVALHLAGRGAEADQIRCGPCEQASRGAQQALEVLLHGLQRCAAEPQPRA